MVSLTLVDLLAPDPGLLHHGLVDLLHLNDEDVAVEDDKAGSKPSVIWSETSW